MGVGELPSGLRRIGGTCESRRFCSNLTILLLTRQPGPGEQEGEPEQAWVEECSDVGCVSAGVCVCTRTHVCAREPGSGSQECRSAAHLPRFET